jgi:hypothetical protein
MSRKVLTFFVHSAKNRQNNIISDGIRTQVPIEGSATESKIVRLASLYFHSIILLGYPAFASHHSFTVIQATNLTCQLYMYIPWLEIHFLFVDCMEGRRPYNKLRVASLPPAEDRSASTRYISAIGGHRYRRQ